MYARTRIMCILRIFVIKNPQSTYIKHIAMFHIYKYPIRVYVCF